MDALDQTTRGDREVTVRPLFVTRLQVGPSRRFGAVDNEAQEAAGAPSLAGGREAAGLGIYQEPARDGVAAQSVRLVQMAEKVARRC
jgi:hypothetical protein